MIWHSFLDFSVFVLIYTKWGFCPVGINTLSCVLVFYGADVLQGGLTANPWLLHPLKFQVRKQVLEYESCSGFCRKLNQREIVVSFARTQQKTSLHKIWTSLSSNEMFAAQAQFLVCIIAKSNSQESKDSALHLLAQLGGVAAWQRCCLRAVSILVAGQGVIMSSLSKC